MRQTWCIVHNNTVYNCANHETAKAAQDWFVMAVIGRGTWADLESKGYEAKRFIEAPT